jgi:hypothetical protein
MEQLEVLPKAQLPITPDHLLDKALEMGADLDKLEKFMDLKDRWDRKNAETAYNEAMSLTQLNIRAVRAKSTNKQTNSKYAGVIDIDSIIRPEYSKNGFAISFDTAESPLPEHVRIVAYVTHSKGHKETRHIDIPADGKGAKGGDVMTKTHAVMSAMTYGQRALMKMIFNVVTGEFDDDGNAAGKKDVRVGISEKQFPAFIEKIKTGEMEIASIKASFRLTPEQTAQLEKLSK